MKIVNVKQFIAMQTVTRARYRWFQIWCLTAVTGIYLKQKNTKVKTPQTST